MYFVYIIKNSANKLYVGMSQNPQQRIHEHNSKQGAHFTKYIPTYKIIFLEQYLTSNEARKREVQIKKWRREKKDILIEKYQKGLETKI